MAKKKASKKTTRPKPATRKTKRRAIVGGAEPLTVAPPPPKHLHDHARELWIRVAPVLVTTKTLTDLHLESFEMLCREWQSYQELTGWLESNPDEQIVENTKGYLTAHPKIQLRQKSVDNLKTLFQQFGLTPSSRKHTFTALLHAKIDGDNELEQFAANK